ncbi:hypothetical protein Tco_1056185 [Tanacetum coccineum]|uniref:Tf2-1-like SH3-like domain-containing protein n=1 Tax=Tanacetum coccineum TaxID=301880 RepID=A0ABQ5H1S3_9ASTR
MGLWYPKGSDFDLTAFSDANHAGCVDTRKSTSGGIQFLGDKLVSWMSKKQDCTAMSSAEVEYVGVICKLCSSNVDEDTASRLWLQLQKNIVVIEILSKRWKLNPRYIGPFKILAKVGTVAYRLEILEQLSRVHSTFHVSNLKKCFSDEPLVIPFDEIQIDDKLNFIEEPVGIMDQEVK